MRWSMLENVRTMLAARRREERPAWTHPRLPVAASRPSSVEKVKVRWVDEDPARYGPLQRGDRVCIRRPDGTHFIVITDLARPGCAAVAPVTVCGEWVLREEWSSSPLGGVVDCKACLTVMADRTEPGA